MISPTLAYRATICLIWGLALWHSWASRGLFVDGSAFLVQIVRREWFFDFYDPRLYAMIVAQIPVMTAVIVGVTDFHLMAQLLSLGLFGLPTGLYHMALCRAKDEPVLLATVMAAIAVVFLTTSFFIIGEYNSSYAIAILTAVRLVTARRLTFGDGIVLVLVSALAIRTYESMIYLGPVLATMILWTLRRAPARPVAPTVLYLLSAAFFLRGMTVAIHSVVYPYSQEHLEETWQAALDFWQNFQFDLMFVAALIVVVWALVRPIDLLRWRPYRWAGFFVAVLALSPLLAFGDNLVRPLAKSQYVARSMGGMVITAMVLFIWAYSAPVHRRIKAMVLLRTEGAARRFLTFACLMVAANIPSDILLTTTWMSYLDAARATVTRQSGLIAFEDTPLAHRPHILFVENWVLSSQSLLLRSKPGDGIIVPPRDFKSWVPFPPLEPPNMGRFVWRE